MWPPRVEELLYARSWTSEAERTRAIAVWNVHYNHHRPHTAAGHRPPASLLRTSVANVMAGNSQAAEFVARSRASQSVRVRRAVAEMCACGYSASNPWKPPAQTWNSAWPPAAQMRVA